MEWWRARHVLPAVFLLVLGAQGGSYGLDLHNVLPAASLGNKPDTNKHDAHIEHNKINIIRDEIQNVLSNAADFENCEYFQLIRNFVDGMFNWIKKRLYSTNDNQDEQHLTKNLADMGNTGDSLKICSILDNILKTANIALSMFEDYKEDFAMDTFSRSWEEVLAENGDTDYGIPPFIPPALEEVDLEVKMVRAFGQLQHHLVGLENVTLDQITFSGYAAVRKTNEENGDVDFYLEKFTNTISYIEQLLGYTRIGMEELGVAPEEGLTRNLTCQVYQVWDTAVKGNRDFIILKKYEDGLRYIITAFTQASSVTCKSASGAFPDIDTLESTCRTGLPCNPDRS